MRTELKIKLPATLYEHIDNIQNGSIASKQILNAVKKGEPIPHETSEWTETGRIFIEMNEEQLLYEVICNKCKGLAFFRKSDEKLVGAKYCPCCGISMKD